MCFQIKVVRRSFCILLVLFVIFFPTAKGQQYLSRQIHIEAKQQRLATLLDSIGRKGGFIFSYNSAGFPADSLVSFKGEMQVEAILDQLLQEKYDYKEIKGYVILRYAPHTFRVYTQSPILTRRGILLSGNIVDETTGKNLENVSIYEKTNLISVLTDKKGYFQIPLVSDSNSITLTVSKLDYHDMVMTILPTVKVQTGAHFDTSLYRSAGSTSDVNRSFLGKMFISTRQKIQSLNISDFFVKRPYQFSVIPKWNSRGDMSGQVVSKFSLNLLAGYNGGVHGFELGSIANLNRTEAEGVQFAGVMNIVGGSSSGLQVAGISNQVYMDGKGLQLAGLRNKVSRGYRGMQVAGLQNKIGGEMQGLQLAGLMNRAGHLKGVQAGLVNKAGSSSGLQFGLVNLLDTASGYGIGLVNIARHNGFYQISLFSSEAAVANVSFKSGREAFYSKLLFGIGHLDVDYFYYGLGVGHIFPSHGKLKTSIDVEVENYARSHNDNSNTLLKSSLEFHLPIAKGLGVFIGPSLNLFIKDKDESKHIDLPMQHYPTTGRNDRISGWVGVNAGFDIL